MTRDDQRAVWAIALAEYTVQTLELKVLGYLSTLRESSLAQERAANRLPPGRPTCFRYPHRFTPAQSSARLRDVIMDMRRSDTKRPRQP